MVVPAMCFALIAEARRAQFVKCIDLYADSHNGSTEFRDLRWATAAFQDRSLRQAAETLRIRQSTLSRCLRSLEHTLGSKLFESISGGTRPTMDGQEFLDAARRIVGDTEALTAQLKIQSRGECGRLIIGIHASISAGN
ncbi:MULTISPECIES: LysR family transcriptional regulator [unclassified Bradyrhizobium]|uniref:LysR family transcriptional regulator n=1 Tax=unclassified Bradyrhizobium TaxID=2631580 RepID=UPI001CD2366A|nr:MULTISPECIES: LysR family transcriptional regulator [unclassified Bradyrhizobium]